MRKSPTSPSPFIYYNGYYTTDQHQCAEARDTQPGSGGTIRDDCLDMFVPKEAGWVAAMTRAIQLGIRYARQRIAAVFTRPPSLLRELGFYGCLKPERPFPTPQLP